MATATAEPRNLPAVSGDGHKHKKSALSDGQARLAWMLLAPTLIIIIVVAGIPVIMSIRESFFATNSGVDPTTGTIRLKGTFANTHQMLWPGQFVQVSLELTTKNNALVVPAKAVQDSQDGQFVYVVSPDRTAAIRKVQVERQQGEEAVIAQGLTAGEEVVTDGQLRLTPGAHVRTDQDGERGAPAAGRQSREGQDAPARASQPGGRGEGGA